MILPFVILGSVATMSGGGGLSAIANKVCFEGYDYSKYRIKKSIEELCSIGALVSVGKSYSLTLLGANLVAADIAAANGVEVLRGGVHGMTMPSYQKGL